MRYCKTFSTSDLEQYFQSRGIEAKFWRDEADYMLHAMIKPDLGRMRIPQTFLSEKITTRKSSWYDKWWARLLRWIEGKFCRINTKIKTHWHLPHWMRELLYANQYEFTYEDRELPVDTLERIHMMRQYLMERDVKPTKILMGHKARLNLEKSFVSAYGDYLIPLGLDVKEVPSIFGIPIQVNPFLSEDAIVVC